jgi:hypothetical protein
LDEQIGEELERRWWRWGGRPVGKSLNHCTEDSCITFHGRVQQSQCSSEALTLNFANISMYSLEMNICHTKFRASNISSWQCLTSLKKVRLLMLLWSEFQRRLQVIQLLSCETECNNGLYCNDSLRSIQVYPFPSRVINLLLWSIRSLELVLKSAR